VPAHVKESATEALHKASLSEKGKDQTASSEHQGKDIRDSNDTLQATP